MTFHLKHKIFHHRKTERLQSGSGPCLAPSPPSFDPMIPYIVPQVHRSDFQVQSQEWLSKRTNKTFHCLLRNNVIKFWFLLSILLRRKNGKGQGKEPMKKETRKQNGWKFQKSNTRAKKQYRGHCCLVHTQPIKFYIYHLLSACQD